MFGLRHLSKLRLAAKISQNIPKSSSQTAHTYSSLSGSRCYQISINKKPQFGFQNFTRHFSAVREPLESLGDSITTAVLLSWSKQPGDNVKEDDVIAVVETDKVTMEIRAKKSGLFVEALVASGAEIAVGSDLYVIDTAKTGTSTISSSTAPAAPVAPEATISAPAASSPGVKTVVPVPVMGESITQGVLAKWSVHVGDYVKADDVIASIETDKVTVDVRSPQDGIISETFAAESAEVNVGEPLFVILAGASPTGTAAKAAVVSPVKAVSAAAPAPPKAVAPVADAKKPAPATSAAAPVKAAPVGERTETRVKMTRMRQRIAQRLKEAQNTNAMLTTFQEVDMTNLMALRSKYKDDFEKVHGVKLGFMSAFVKAATNTLQEIPAVNGVIDDATQEIVYRNYVDVSVAVASPTGLVVPVLRNTEKMTFADIEKAISEYGNKAKKGTLALEDMAGGTFTITNGGVFGSLFSTPMINPPQSAILGMHATKMRAVVVDGKVEARPMMYLALTYDHRLIDGREAVVFLKSVAQKIEEPGKMLLNL